MSIRDTPFSTIILTVNSGIADCEIVETCIGDTDVAVVDCPGFDDSVRSEAEILSIRVSASLSLRNTTSA